MDLDETIDLFDPEGRAMAKSEHGEESEEEEYLGRDPVMPPFHRSKAGGWSHLKTILEVTIKD